MRVQALIIRILRQFIHDKRTMALMILAPALILFMMSLVFNGDAFVPKLGTVQVPPPLVSVLQEQGAEVTVYSLQTEPSDNNALKALQQGQIDAIIQFDGSQPNITLEGSDPAAARVVLMMTQKAMQQRNPTGAATQPIIEYLHGSADMAPFDYFGPVLIGLFVFFFVFLISGVSFLRERTGGTLELLLASPLKRWEIVIGYVAGFGIFTMLQSTFIAWFSIDLLQMKMEGSFWLVLLITMLLAFSALTIGTFLSAFANNEFQMIQFIPLVVVPQVFFSGLFSLDTMHVSLRWLSHIMPLSYGAEAMREVMVRGGGWNDIASNVFVLLGLSIVVMGANVLALKKHRRL